MFLARTLALFRFTKGSVLKHIKRCADLRHGSGFVVALSRDAENAQRPYLLKVNHAPAMGAAPRPLPLLKWTAVRIIVCHAGGAGEKGRPDESSETRKSQSAWEVSMDYRQTTHRALVGRLASGWALAALVICSASVCAQAPQQAQSPPPSRSPQEAARPRTPAQEALRQFRLRIRDYAKFVAHQPRIKNL